MKKYEVLSEIGPIVVEAETVKIQNDGRLDFVSKENGNGYISASFAAGRWSLFREWTDKVYMSFPDGTCIALMPNTFSRVFDYNRDLWIKGETE